MLYESQVIDSVCGFLEKHRFQIVQRLSERQRGDDIIANSPFKDRVFIEAKGGTSSKEGTKRFGKPFSSSQVTDHVANAVYKACKYASKPNVLAGIALPKNDRHIYCITPVLPALRVLGIEVFWASPDGLISKVEGIWDYWKKHKIQLSRQR